jgi:pantoate--beta-alanine ligase
MRIIDQLDEWRRVRRSEEIGQKSVGLVPTMGNLHAGHRSLLERCRRDNDLVVMTLFVNPVQFDDPRDLSSYPRTFEADVERADEWGVDFLLTPAPESVYPDGYRFRVTESELSKRFCGKHRPGHFDGVLTVVMKLLNLVRADRAYFGEKDFQQFLLVREMARSFFLETEIVPCPIIRDRDGLALSSRNSRLFPEQREIAARFPRILAMPGSCEDIKAQLEAAGFGVDYVEDYEGRRLAAVRIGNVRLIDNFPLRK